MSQGTVIRSLIPWTLWRSNVVDDPKAVDDRGVLADVVPPGPAEGPRNSLARQRPVDYHPAPGPEGPGAEMRGDRARVVDATDIGPAEWDSLAVRSPQGHAFQSHAWGELKRPLGWIPHRYVIEIDGDLAAVVSFQERALARRLPGPLGRLGFLYAPRGPILLRPEPRAAQAALAGIREIAARLGTAVVTIDPVWPADGSLATELDRAGFAPAARDVQVSRTAMIVPLLEDEAAQHRLVRKSTANLVNKARREGAVAERVDLAGNACQRDQALEEMHDLLAATARREGIVLRDRAYQLAQWRALGEAGIARLWSGRVGDRRWTGSVLLECGKTLVQYQAGSADDADLRAVPANHLLQWEIMRWAAGAGFSAYDLGGVDTARAPGLPADERHPLWNLYVFKRGFGARGVEYVRAHEFAPNPLCGLGWRLARTLR